MISNLLQIGNKIDIVRVNNSFNMGKQDVHYTSQLFEYEGLDEATIAMPIAEGVVIPLENGATYCLSFFTDNGIYECQGTVTKRFREQNIYMIKIRFISDFQKNQRRAFFRLECLLDINYRIDTNEEEEILRKIRENDFASEEELKEKRERLKELQSTWILAVATDISGGGLRCNSESECKKDDRIWMKLRLHNNDDVKDMEVMAVVIASMPLKNKPGFFEHRTEFVDIIRTEREAIIRFIFEEERRQRRREKGYD